MFLECSMKNKLHRKDLPGYRTQQLRKQKHLCPLCRERITPDQAVLDHDHETGHVRKVLHRQCNSIEGRVLQWLKRSGKDITPEQFLKNILVYWLDDYTRHKIHPTHLTEQERELNRLRKKLRTSKRESTKNKYKKLIEELSS